ncbi:DNA ligase [Phyllosticta citriasiana]|uniref:DNA ligase n=1 Tax=Phyllosticta citriasiana TaxID=595635 RepID=UPI0030FD3FDC
MRLRQQLYEPRRLFSLRCLLSSISRGPSVSPRGSQLRTSIARVPLRHDFTSVAMPPKQQATLGYVKPNQKTLGSFFNKPAGAKAEPRQSRLAFSTKTKGKSTETSDAPVDESTKDNVDLNGQEGKHEAVEEDAEMSGENGAQLDSKKRTREESEEDEEPVTTKRRTRRKKDDDSASEATATPQSPGKKRKSTAKKNRDESLDEPKASPRKSKAKAKLEKVEDGLEEEREAPKAASTKKSKAKSKTENQNDHPEDEQEATKPASPKQPKTKAKSTAARKKAAVEEDELSEPPSSKHSNASSAEKESDRQSASPPPKAAPTKTKKASSKKANTWEKTFNHGMCEDWKAGEPVPFAALCQVMSKIENTSGRLEMQNYATRFFCQVLRLTPDDLLHIVLLLVNKLAADYKGIELGVGEALIQQTIAEATGREKKKIVEQHNKVGDWGLVAAQSRANQPTMFKPKPLSVRSVREDLIKISRISGSGTNKSKLGIMTKLLCAADAHGKVDTSDEKGGPSEAKFITRFFEGKLRLGLAEQSVLLCLAHALAAYKLDATFETMPTPEELQKSEQLLKDVYSELPSYEDIIPVVLKHGLDKAPKYCTLHPGVPIKPMLANPTKSIAEVLQRFENKSFTCEYKYDGERAQIHFVAHGAKQTYDGTEAPAAGKTERGVANIFSRNSEDLSGKYPDILSKLPTWVKEDTQSFVLDCETVAWDMVEKKVLPFQKLMTRKRKDVKVEDVKVKVCVFAFDLLYLNGERLTRKSFRERRELLHNSFVPVEGEFSFAEHGDASDVVEIQELLDHSIKASCEGLMVKMLDGSESNYLPSKRSQNWLKVKKDYLNNLGDSLDLVVLGAYYGKGKRTSVYGAFLLACYDPNSETYQTVCNIGTGFSDEALASLHAALSEHVIEKPKPFYSHSSGNTDQPDVWFEPRFVWEVKSADLTVSPRYRAAIEELGVGKGISLRFPRFIRVRDDKKPEEATSSDRVADMYRAQEVNKKSKGPSADDGWDY